MLYSATNNQPTDIQRLIPYVDRYKYNSCGELDIDMVCAFDNQIIFSEKIFIKKILASFGNK